jgi:hypothetical protein
MRGCDGPDGGKEGSSYPYAGQPILCYTYVRV